MQNSRDAGASRIAFTVAVNSGEETLACEDDGGGMTRADVSKYLLRLYASGKAPHGRETQDDRAAGPVGRFGVGFWSILRFGPARILVESRRGGASTAFAVDCERFVIEELPCTLAADGTRVTLSRRASGDDLRGVVRDKLRYWCGPVTGLRGGTPPRLTLDGEELNERLTPPELIGERLRGRGFDGVVGLDRQPAVRLYSHGLLIRDVGSLEELLPRRARGRDVGAPGLHPVVKVNADGLEVLMNRQAVVEDQLLVDVVRTAEKRLLRLRHRLLDRLAPLRLVDRLRVAWPRVSGLAALYVVAVLGGAAGVASLPVASGGGGNGGARPVAEASGPRPLPAAVDASGPRINQPRTVVGDFAPWDIRVRGEGTHLLRLSTHSRYDEARGLVADRVVPAIGEYVFVDNGRGALEVDAAVPLEARWMMLPVPAGWGIVAGSARVDGREVEVRPGAWGEPLVRADGVRVRYLARPRPREPGPPPIVGTTPLPPESSRLTPQRRARLVASKVPRLVEYSTSTDDAARFDDARGSFVERVREVGRGDCDVMNAYAALLLRAYDVPAHLAVGLVVEDGDVAIDLHAWTEYFDGVRWRALDVSPPVELPTAPTAAAIPGEPAKPGRVIQLGEPSAAGDVERRPTAPAVVAPPPQKEPWLTLPDVPGLPSPDLSPGARRWVLFGAGAVGTGVFFALIGLLLLRPRGERLDDETLAALLVHHLRGPRGSDPLHLRHRPFFRTLAGRRLSLADLERLAAAGKLFAARPGQRLLRYLRSNAPVLDRSDPKLEALLPLLPQVTRMQDLKAIVERTTDPAAAEVERLLRELDDDVRVHVAQERDDVREVALPVAPAGLAPRHILIGVGHPVFQELSALHEREPELATYRLLRAVLDRTTLYRGQRDALLARAARRVLT